MYALVKFHTVALVQDRPRLFARRAFETGVFSCWKIGVEQVFPPRTGCRGLSHNAKTMRQRGRAGSGGSRRSALVGDAHRDPFATNFAFKQNTWSQPPPAVERLGLCSTQLAEIVLV